MWNTACVSSGTGPSSGSGFWRFAVDVTTVDIFIAGHVCCQGGATLRLALQGRAIGDGLAGDHQHVEDDHLVAGRDDRDGVRSSGEFEVLVVAPELLDPSDACAVHVDVRAPGLDVELDAAGRRAFRDLPLLEGDALGHRGDEPRRPDRERAKREDRADALAARRTRTGGWNRRPRYEPASELSGDGRCG